MDFETVGGCLNEMRQGGRHEFDATELLQQEVEATGVLSGSERKAMLGAIEQLRARGVPWCDAPELDIVYELFGHQQEFRDNSQGR
jgi:hypothetical protein